jgi:hypothetical protein
MKAMDKKVRCQVLIFDKSKESGNRSREPRAPQEDRHAKA